MDQAWPRKSTRSESSSKLIQLQRQSSTTNVNASSLLNAGSGAASSAFSHTSSTQGILSSSTGATAAAAATAPGTVAGGVPSSSSSLLSSSSSLESSAKHFHENLGGIGSMGSSGISSSGSGISSSSSSGVMGASGITGGHHPSTSLSLHHSNAGTSEIHPLHFNWVFWFMHRAPGSKIVNYESSMKKIATFGSVEDFWAVYSHLRRPHELPNVSDYHLFKQGVRPVWEDATNINGGKWIVRLKKGLASRYWENLVMAVIGDQFDVGSEICGIVLSIRGAEDILSLWNQSAHEGRINLKIRDTMKRVLNLPPDTIMEYKTHNDALKDNSSFRNTDVFR
ncbi:Eukaryotic translation initiation factor 4E type 2 [Actinomortierella ambigua]|nr:Eukaryotic translation initiation factor 4E type 2 [Actinomortierella ambigua]